MQHASIALLPSAIALLNEVIFMEKRQFCAMELFKDITDECTKKDRKTKVPFTGRIEKREFFTHIGVGGKSTYGELVNQRLTDKGEEATFEAAPLPWGQFLPGSLSIIEHTKAGDTESQLYIRLWMYNDTQCRVVYYLNGVETAECDLPDVLPVKKSYSGSGRQADVNLTLAEQAKPFTPAFRNIVRTKINGKEFIPFAIL